MARPQIPLSGGLEQDALTGWRKVLCYMSKPGIVRYVKRKYNKRVRRYIKQNIMVNNE